MNTKPEYIELWDNHLYSLLRRKFKADKIRTRYDPEKDQISITIEYCSVNYINCKYYKTIENVHSVIMQGISQEQFVREMYATILEDIKSLFFRK